MKWSGQEDQVLKSIVENNAKAHQNWTQISIRLSVSFPNRMRNGKQCRERYLNYSRFQKQGAWTPEEEEIFFHYCSTMGSKWAEIASLMPGKSKNSLKNKFYCLLRKLLRRINQNRKFGASLKYSSLTRVMDVANGFIDLPFLLAQKSKQLRNKIIQAMRIHECELDQTIEHQIHEFNSSTKCYNFRKCKNKHKVMKIQSNLKKFINYTATSQEKPIQKPVDCKLDELNLQSLIQISEYFNNEQNLEAEVCCIFDKQYIPREEVLPYL